MLNNYSQYIRLSLLLLCTSCHFNKYRQAEPSAPFVILKLDDLWYEDGLVHPGWIQVFDFLQDEEVVGTIGLVCNSLEEGSDDYFQWIKDREAEGHEIWHHGYCHCKPMMEGVERREFRGMDYSYQYDHLWRAHQLAKEKLDITFRTFGAPYNSTDAHTARALDSLPEIKIWLYKETDAFTSKHVLRRIPEVNIEYPVHVPDFAKFKEGYEEYKGSDLLVIQGHPRSWVDDPDRFDNFRRIILFLKSEKVNFITPYEYYQRQESIN